MQRAVASLKLSGWENPCKAFQFRSNQVKKHTQDFQSLIYPAVPLSCPPDSPASDAPTQSPSTPNTPSPSTPEPADGVWDFS
ncbi:hypothetical protein MHYP_G00360070 [Metynnis hypsauchen]